MGKDLTKMLLMKQMDDEKKNKERWREDDYDEDYAYRGGRSGGYRTSPNGSRMSSRNGGRMNYTYDKGIGKREQMGRGYSPIDDEPDVPPEMYDMWPRRKYPFYDMPPYEYGYEPNRYGSRSIMASGDIRMEQPWMEQPYRKGYPRIEHYGEAVQPINQAKARKIVHKMKNVDGTDGEHWDMEQTEQLRGTYAPDCKPAEFYIAMNMMYSDYADVAKKYGTDKPEFYASMACSFLCDDDAVEDKMQKYIQYIVE